MRPILKKSTKSDKKPSLVKRAKNRLRSDALEHERLVSLINSMGDGVIAVDAKLKVVTYNGAALNILDSNTSMQGKKISGLLKFVDKNKQHVDVAKLITGTTYAINSRDYAIKYTDGTLASVYVSIAPVHTGYKGKGLEGYVLVLRDITREKSLEDERSEFISVVSHELRTPIAIAEGNISNALFMADKTKDITVIKQALNGAYDQVSFLADMINDLATLSRAERDKLVVEPESIDITELLADLSNNYEPQAAKKHLSFIAQPPAKGLVLVSSRLYVREVLQNFITNAIKYTEAGSVTISAKASKTGVCFTVTDTGIGISKSDQAKVFDKFFRSEDFRTRQTSGTGLGLYVTMKLARILHADIDVTSSIGKGSTFTIDVPSSTI